MKLLLLAFLAATVMAAQSKPVMADMPMPVDESVRMGIIKNQWQQEAAKRVIADANETIKKAQAEAGAAAQLLTGFLSSADKYCASIKRTFDRKSLSCLTTTNAPPKKE